MKLTGAFTALVTPFTPDGSAVDYEKLRELVEWQIQEGIDGLVPVSFLLMRLVTKLLICNCYHHADGYNWRMSIGYARRARKGRC